MAVALDAKGDFSASHDAVTTYTSTTFTVGSGANRALIVGIACESGIGNHPTAPTAVWDAVGANQSMTLIAASTFQLSSSSDFSIFLFGLVAPVSGNKTLTIANMNGAAGSSSIVSMISFTGVDQTGGTTTFKNGNKGNNGTTTISYAPTTVAGDAVATVFGSGFGGESFNQTVWANLAQTSVLACNYDGQYALAVGTTTTMTMTQGGAATEFFSGVVLNQAGAAVALVAPMLGVGAGYKHPIQMGPFDFRVMPQPAALAISQALSGLTFIRTNNQSALAANANLSAFGAIKSVSKGTVASSVALAGKIFAAAFSKLSSSTGTVSLAAKVLITSFSKASSISKTAIAGKAFASMFGKASSASSTVLAAKAFVASFGKASLSSSTVLAAKSFLASYGKASIVVISTSTALLAKGFSSLRSSAGATLAVSFAATTKASLFGKANVSLLSRLTALGLASLRSAAGAAGKVSVAARSFAALTAKAGATFPARLSGTALAAAVGKAASLTGKVSLAGASLVALFGKMAKPGALQLLAAGFMRLAASAGISGKTSMTGTLKVTSAGQANATITRFLTGKAFGAFRASGGLLNSVSLSAIATTKAFGKASFARLILLSGYSLAAARSVATVTGVVSIRGRALIAMFARSSLFATAPTTQMTGRSFIKFASRAILFPFRPRRIANTTAEMRSATAELKRTVPIVSDDRSAETTAEKRVAIASVENRSDTIPKEGQ